MRPPCRSRILCAVRQERFTELVRADAKRRLAVKPDAKRADVLAASKRFLKIQEHRLRLAHRAGAGGRETAEGRAFVFDVLLRHLFATAPGAATVPVTLVAVGGHGRGELCPHSDIDLMFLHESATALDGEVSPPQTLVVP